MTIYYIQGMIYNKKLFTLVYERRDRVGKILSLEAGCPSVLVYATGVVMSGFY